MVNCKNYKIYKFNFSIKRSNDLNDTKLHSDRKIRIQEMFDFKKKLIDKFASEKYDDLIKYTLLAKYYNIEYVEYVSDRVWPYSSQVDIGLDILQKEYDVRCENHWYHKYFIVPIVHQDIIEFFDSNIPSWVVTVKRV